MARRKKKKPSIVDMALQWLELHQAISLHCTAIRATVQLWESGNQKAAQARLEGALAALEGTIRSQAATCTIACPECQSDEGVKAWVYDHKCGACGAYLAVPETSS